MCEWRHLDVSGHRKINRKHVCDLFYQSNAEICERPSFILCIRGNPGHPIHLGHMGHGGHLSHPIHRGHLGHRGDMGHGGHLGYAGHAENLHILTCDAVDE